MKVNIGGDRIGSGAKMNVSLHNYYRSTHNLNKKFQSTLAPGILYPAYVNIGLNGDKFDIDINSIIRTLPTQGPLFGSFKVQIDTFVAPFRLYHGILHNNPINIGLKMKDVKLPYFQLTSYAKKDGKIVKQQIHPSNLWKYLGMSGLGRQVVSEELQQKLISRDVNGVPLLAYYDIFKNYYANKQEDNAYVITQNFVNVGSKIESVWYCPFNNGNEFNTENCNNWVVDENKTFAASVKIHVFGENLLLPNWENELNIDNWVEKIGKYVNIQVKKTNGEDYTIIPAFGSTDKHIIFNVNADEIRPVSLSAWNGNAPMPSWEKITSSVREGIKLQPFELENIDKMRELLLNIKLGERFNISKQAKDNNIAYPYIVNSQNEVEDSILYPMSGLCVKTYQSDMFNNWIKTETIDGANGIREITTIDTTNGLEMDALNLAQKVYNMLNRIAVSGGTYEDWQEAVYTQSAIRKAETPMYMGGYSSEIMFEEVLATAATDTTEQQNTPLGSMGGRGKEVKSKGGRVKFTIEEPSIIMIMLSITPRITYSQGNKWFLTDLESIDDLHKPALDGIGYQDLIVEQMTWNGTTINANNKITERLSAGKVPTWLNYMTDVNECYGEFAMEESKAFMVLNRNYDMQADKTSILKPSDITTYIDPKKFNYAFAYNEREAQNFWAEVQFDITARRLMSAKQIPNL